MNAERTFSKYSKSGAYHWRQFRGGIRRMNAFVHGRYTVVLRMLADAHIGAKAHVLDLGCGDGALAGAISESLRSSVTGVDPSSQGIALARQEFARHGLHGTFVTVAGYDLPFADGAFDAVISSDVIEHVAEPERLLTEALRVTRPGGLLVVTTPIRTSEHPPDPEHVQEWFPDEFKTLIQRTVGVTPRMHYSHPLAWYEWYLQRGALGPVPRLVVNALAYCGRNPFVVSVGHPAWKNMMLQTAIIRKP